MLRKAITTVTVAILLAVCISPAEAQSRKQPPKADSVISLLNAEWAKLVKLGFHNFRLIKGPAAFYHNGAYLFCDSAAWDIDQEIIKAYGKVRLVQDNTVLRSDSLTYLIKEDLAQFRGPLVDVFDNEGDTLRTNNLDYNTKDSLAIFRNGGAMKDKEGNVIEGTTGIYTSGQKTFTFQDNVQMFTDSIFLATEKMDYLSQEKKAYFRDKTYVWRQDGFMKALAGWYDTENEIIHFSKDVYIKDPDYEMWADEVFYYRNIPRYEAYHNVQVLDTLHESAFVAHKAVVQPDSLGNQHMEFTMDPAVFYYGENENHEKDSLFFAADTLLIYTVRKCDIPADDIERRLKDREDILFDAIAEAETKAAEEREKARAEAEAQRPENIARVKRQKIAAQKTVDSLAALGQVAPDSLYILLELDPVREKAELYARLGITPDETEQEDGQQDQLQGGDSSEAQPAPAKPAALSGAAGGLAGRSANLALETAAEDSVAAAAPVDSTLAAAPPALPDTTKIQYLHGWPNVRIYRSDLQLLCDSLAYSDIDSLARMFGDPVMWYKTRNQLTSDLMILLMKDETLHKGSMQQNAMLVMQEDSVHFDQIKSTEMVGHFRDDDLYRYDALGGVNAMFYLKEKEEITTINIKESQFMTMALKEGTAQRIKYYEQTQSDAHPVFNLEIDKQRIKGFQWRGDERPVSRFAITSRSLRNSERDEYKDVRMPQYRVANRYFNRYMSKIYAEMAAREEARMMARMHADSVAAAAADSSLVMQQDSVLLQPDILVADILVADTLSDTGPAAGQETALGTPEETEAQQGDNAGKPAIAGTGRRSEEQPVEDYVTEQSVEQPALTKREKRILRKADRLIEKSNKKFFKRLYREVMRRKTTFDGLEENN